MPKCGLRLQYIYIFLSIVAIWLFFYAGSAKASDGDCIICHGSIVSDFTLPPVDRNNCYACHQQQEHYNNRANVRTDYGYFQSIDSPFAPSATVHGGPSGTFHVDDGFPNLYCERCHATASCSACHGTVAHGQHGGSQKQPVTEITTLGGYFNFPEPETFYCGISECHTTLPGVVCYRPDDKDLCLNCHLADKSGHGAVHISSFIAGTTIDCSTCHYVYIDDEHLRRTDSGGNPYTCGTCHSSTRSDVQQAIADHQTNCDACHPNIKSEGHNHPVGADGYSATPNPACNGCHATNPDGTAEVTAVHQKAADAGKIPNYSCSTCHNAAFEGVVIPGDGILDMKRNGTSVIYCDACHNGTLAPAKEASHQPEHQAKHSANNMDCSSCHSFTIPAGVYQDISSTAVHSSCNTCHGSSTRNDVKSFIASRVGQDNLGYNCEDCHGVIHLGWEDKHRPSLPSDDPNLVCTGCHGNYLPAEHTKAFPHPTLAYAVYRSPDGTNNWTEIGTTTTTDYADTGLSGSTTYYYKVRAYDGKPNYSDFSTVCSVTTPANRIINTSNPSSAKYCSGHSNGDYQADPDTMTGVLSTLTDNNNSTYCAVAENGSNDKYIFVRKNQDAGDYTKVKLKMVVRYVNATNLTIYPYRYDGVSVNTDAAYTVDGPSRTGSASFITETIDVTKAAQAMKGLGWMKFRIKPDPSKPNTSVYIANVKFVLTQTATSGAPVTNLPGILASNSSDSTAPTTPTNLTGTANYYDRIDLFWTGSTDAGSTPGETDTCVLCHSSSAPQRVKDAVMADDPNCRACHDKHSDIPGLHTGNALATSPWDCGVCHTSTVSIEHSANAVLKHNAVLDCLTCHQSALGRVDASIESLVTDRTNLNCDACHSGTADGAERVHSDIVSPHLTGIFPAATDGDCLNCHPAQASEFDPNNGSYHAVVGESKMQQTFTAADGNTYYYGKFANGWTATSRMHCTDCHGNGQKESILKGPWIVAESRDMYAGTGGEFTDSTGHLCFNCHDKTFYDGGDGDYSEDEIGSDTVRSKFYGQNAATPYKYNYHAVHKDVACAVCHGRIPHGFEKRGLLVEQDDPAPYSQNSFLNIMIFSQPGGWSCGNCKH